MKTARYGNSINIGRADLLDLDRNEEVLQTGFWARFKGEFGWRAHPLMLGLEEGRYPLLILTRKLAPRFTLAYIPFGPALPEPVSGREEFLVELGRRIAVKPDVDGNVGLNELPRSTFIVRFDLPWERQGMGNFPARLAEEKYFRKAPMDIQPTSTTRLDLRRTEQEILSSMKHKTRYNIRLSSRKGVVIEEAGEERLDSWHKLYRTTARRDRIAMHSLEYCRTLFRVSREYGRSAPVYRLLLAKFEGELLAGIIVAFRGKRAWYPFGASSGHRRNFMPTYALQWRAIQMAKERGCETYDFCGIPPSSDKSHPMFGLFQFKTGFGGAVINRCGCWDVIVRKPEYFLYTVAERARKYYYMEFRKSTGP